MVDRIVCPLLIGQNYYFGFGFTTLFLKSVKLFFFRNSHFTVDSDSSWLDFLNKAIDHNQNKITGLLQEQEGSDT